MNLIEREGIVHLMKLLRLRCSDHVTRMEDERISKEILEAEIIGQRRKGRGKKEMITGC